MQVKILIMNERSCSLGVVAAVVVDCEQVPPSSGRNLQKTSCCPRPDTFFPQVALTPLLLGPKHRTKQKLNMASVLYRLAVPRCSLLRRLAVPLRETQRLKHHGLHRDGTRLLAGESRSLAACSRADSRSQHTAPEASVEVDLKRLEGQDEGREKKHY